MKELYTAYCKLISSPAQIMLCKQAKTLTDLLSVIKSLWNKPYTSDDWLLAEIKLLNQQLLDDENLSLSGHWLPYAYHSKTWSISWCLPDGHVTEPFQDQYISRCRQTILFNQIIQPRTSLNYLSRVADAPGTTFPAGFIFHLSRCGSTLVSGCLSELESTTVLSESPLLTSILLDRRIDVEQQRFYLRKLIVLQSNLLPHRSAAIVKWNAWDIFRWELIRSIFPEVPMLFLVRNPPEILASHRRSVGRHMSGDLSLTGLHPIFASAEKANSVLEYRVGVLQGLMSEMFSHCRCPDIKIVDYVSLDVATLIEIANHFNLQPSVFEIEKIRKRMRFHSKDPENVFHADAKQPAFCFRESELIRKSLSQYYKRLTIFADQADGDFRVG